MRNFETAHLDATDALEASIALHDAVADTIFRPKATAKRKNPVISSEGSLCIDLHLTSGIGKTEIRFNSEIEEITGEDYIRIAKEKYNTYTANEFDSIIAKYSDNEVAMLFAEAMAHKNNERRKVSAEKAATKNRHILNIVRDAILDKVNVGNAFLLEGMVNEIENRIGTRNPRVIGKALEIMEDEGLLKVEKRRIFMPDKTRIRKVYIRVR